MSNAHFVYALDTLRNERKMAQHVFLEGIISDRQYRRYLNRDAEMTLSTLLQLLERLEMTLDQFFDYANQVKNEKDIYLSKLHRYVMDFDYDNATAYLQRKKKYELSKDDLTLLQFYEHLITFYARLEKNPEADIAFVQNLLNETQLLDVLSLKYISISLFSFINLIVNKTYNLFDHPTQIQFQQFYLDLIDEKKLLIDESSIENRQLFYSYYISTIYGQSFISQEATRSGGQLLLHAIKLTEESLMSYNLMALNYLNSSMCYANKKLEKAKLSQFYTIMSVMAQPNHMGIFPAFKQAFSQVVDMDTFIAHFDAQLEYHMSKNTLYYEEVETYDDLSTFFSDPT